MSLLIPFTWLVLVVDAYLMGFLAQIIMEIDVRLFPASKEGIFALTLNLQL
jgi:hypothetical protein